MHQLRGVGGRGGIVVSRSWIILYYQILFRLIILYYSILIRLIMLYYQILIRLIILFYHIE